MSKNAGITTSLLVTRMLSVCDLSEWVSCGKSLNSRLCTTANVEKDRGKVEKSYIQKREG